MAETTKPAPKAAARRSTAKDESSGAFTAEEKAAMRERAKEVRAAKRGTKADPEAEVLARIAEMGASDRAMAERVHAVVTTTAPDLVPRTWYGMPAYAKDGKVLCFFQGAGKFKARYATLGFNDPATLDDGPMWATAFALTEVTPAVEKRIAALVRQAVG
ncbi:MAG TPA: DUF1801 domain-containing protein [Acidimicrobiales bacterium]|nr:DUF1801 domain-containing protein [Acidimicrobiales bacterium]